MKLPKEVSDALGRLGLAALGLLPDLIDAIKEKNAQRIQDISEEMARRDAFDQMMSSRAKSKR